MNLTNKKLIEDSLDERPSFHDVESVPKMGLQRIDEGLNEKGHEKMEELKRDS